MPPRLIPQDDAPAAPTPDLRPAPELLRLASWNVNGIRAALKKGFDATLDALDVDVLCLQEAKARPEQVPPDAWVSRGYASQWNPADRPGYSGTTTLTRIVHTPGRGRFDAAILNGEGRIVETRIGDVSLFNVYFPNGKRDATRLQYKMGFYDAFLALIEDERRRGRGVVFCGDVNTAHRDIDLAHPKENRKISGFLPEECAWIDRVVALGYIDTFRQIHPDERDAYSWWDQLTRARDRNVGWRIDYFFVSPELKDRVADARIHQEILGSDHCPVSLTLRSR